MHQRGYVWQIRFFLMIYTFIEYISQVLPQKLGQTGTPSSAFYSGAHKR
jgi:hypothetical protein